MRPNMIFLLFLWQEICRSECIFEIYYIFYELLYLKIKIDIKNADSITQLKMWNKYGSMINFKTNKASEIILNRLNLKL